MSERDVRERDILVAPSEYGYVQDLTKGDIVLYVGPTKISLSNTERLVELRGTRFVPVRADDPSLGVSSFVSATSSQYVVLENPAKDAAVKPTRGNNAAVELRTGRKVVVPGPVAFPLWPGQRARVIDGHPLREDEYLIVRSYDLVEGDARPIGAEEVIRGSEVSFYVPTTGLEVVPVSEAGGVTTYVRKARRFPRPGGLYLRVIKAFDATAGHALPEGSYAAGTDVFLKDREGFFFPSERIEVLGEIHPIPIAEKEGIYIRDLATGKISTVSGPCNYLIDPTREEVAERELDEATLELYGLREHDPLRAVSVYIPPSYAVLVTGKARREVVLGPQTRILDYDEELAVLQLSTGKPKSDDVQLKTCLLLVDGNKVSDVVRVRTADHVELEVTLSYRVSFVGHADSQRWFNVKDYVGLLCDHLGSILRAAARAAAIDSFYAEGTELLRTAVLGEKKDGPRAGRHFEENGMWVYDLEVLEIHILDAEVKKLLADAQRGAIVADVARRQEELRLASEQLRERVTREIATAQVQTLATTAELERARAELARSRTAATIDLGRLEQLGKAQADAEALALRTDAESRARERTLELDAKQSETRVTAFREQMAAIAPELVSTLKTLGHQQLTAELSRNVAPLAILGGNSISEVVERLLGSLPLGSDATVAQVVRKAGKP